MGSLPWKARIYIGFLTALMAGAVFFSISALGKDLISWATVTGIAIIIAVLDVFNIRHFGVQIEVSVSNALKFALVLVYPIPIVIFSVFLGTILGEIMPKRAWFKKLFNIAELTITWVITAWVFFVFNDSRIDYFGSLGNVFAFILAAAISFVINLTLVCLVISLAARLPFLYVLKQNSKVMVWHEISLFTLGIFLAVLWRFNPASVVLAGLPLFVVRDAYKTANQLRNQTQDALRALVRVVDERDHHTMDHSERVSNYSRSIAEALDLPQEEIEVIASAAMLHDLGKVGMADDILFNPKSLNSDERKRAEHHAPIGAMLLSKFPLFDKGAILVRHHHEHYDGNGYPDGLNGEDIPLGSRIISVADAYQAMTENRPYRRALTPADAIARLVEGSGTQFDPRVVRAFAKTMEMSTDALKPTVAVIPTPIDATNPAQV